VRILSVGDVEGRSAALYFARKEREVPQGFMYSDRLLRHEREVHKLHGRNENALYCPHRNCKRHSSPAKRTWSSNCAAYTREPLAF
jgi:hypothetical protein